MKKLFTLLVLTTMLFSAGFAETCDTLFNLKSVLDTATIYFADTGVTPGYLSGNNEFGDLAKAEAFPAIIGDTIESAIFYFAVVDINSTDTNKTVTLAVWDNTGTTGDGLAGAPGNMIDSATVTLGQIAQVVTLVNNTQTLEGMPVNFTHNAVLTTDTFFVGVILPTSFGDTVALFTNIAPPGPDGNGWEYEIGQYPGWYTYDEDWNIPTGSSLGNYIVAAICGTPTGINTVTDGVTMNIFPNPANSQLNFQWNVDDAAEVDMYDVAGNMLKSFAIQGTALNTFDIHDLAPGTYIIRVTDKQTNLQHSTLFTKL